MHQEPLLIALDGPVGAGKSSLAKAVADKLNILHLDTGAMYRAVALAVLDRGISPLDEAAVSALCEKGEARVDVRFVAGTQQTLLNDVPVDQRLRSQEVGSAASSVSRYQAVRSYLVSRQQAMAATQSMIIDGRDIGTAVLPQAKLKIYLTASAQERARRRYEQIRDKQPEVSYQAVLQELMLRDKQDMEREITPLRQAADAVLLDTTGYSFEQSVAAILDIVEARHGSQG